MKLELFHVDAFASEVFRGNPAAVVPLQRWLPDGVMQAIGMENNLSETAFIVPAGKGAGAGEYEIRWFTPSHEVDLCGHATLAAAHVIFGGAPPAKAPERLRFLTRQAGDLEVLRDGRRYLLDFPVRPGEQVRDLGLKQQVEHALGVHIKELWQSRDLMAVVENEELVRQARPDMAKVAAIEAFAVMLTAPGPDCDFVSRFFAPRAGVPEDPVTGSAHCTLIPYWARRLSKHQLFARQVSRRGGELWCALCGQRVHIAGEAVTYLTGTISLPDQHAG